MDWESTARVLVEHLAPPLLTILSGVLAALGAVALRRLYRWLGLRETTEAELAWRQIVDGGVAYARHRAIRWAKGHRVKPASTLKLSWALEWITAQAAAAGLPQKARDELERLIEARLGDPTSPDGPAQP